MLAYERYHFCEESKESEGVEAGEHCAYCVGGELCNTSCLHCTQVSELISCVTCMCQFQLRIGDVEILGDYTVSVLLIKG